MTPERLPHAFAEEMDPSVGSLRTIQQMLENQMSSDELRPCPFCGGKRLDVLRAGADDECTFIQCRDCEAGGPTSVPRSEETAIDAWNRRAEAEAHVAGPKDGLAEAMEHLRRESLGEKWCESEIGAGPGPADAAIATILNAVLSGQLVPATPPANDAARDERRTVKPLVFSEFQNGGCVGRPHSFQYFITQDHQGRFWCLHDNSQHDSLLAAQAHAQAHYQVAAMGGSNG